MRFGVISRQRRRMTIPSTIVVTLLAVMLSLAFAVTSYGQARAAGEQLTQISSDPYTNTASQHKTEVEPDTFAFGKTVVSTFQVGRIFGGGSANIGFATSTNGGETWVHGFLPGTTVNATPPGIYTAASDASVAYDARDKVWLTSYLGLFPGGNTAEVDVLVSRSTDGGLTWGSPVVVNASGDFNDKNWSVCDTTASSPHFGNCYTEYDDNSLGDLEQMSTSTDGGLTWGPGKATADNIAGIGGQPVVQPNGTVIVPFVDLSTPNFLFAIGAFMSTDGGATWSATTFVSEADFHNPNPGGPLDGIRADIPLPSAEIDRSGRVYVAWSDCRFEASCLSSDIVLSSSANGTTWTPVSRIPTDPLGSVDHFIPGLAVDRSTSGHNAHLGLTYYYYPHANCTVSTCQLKVGFISSTNGGTSWSKSEQLAGPMNLTWLASTSQGFMVGDYISTSIVPGDDDATPVFEVAFTPSGGLLHENTYTTPEDVLKMVGGTITSAGDKVVFHSNRGASKVTLPTAY